MRLRAPRQLKVTAALVAGLVSLPALLLLVFPRGRAAGLERLLSQVSLLQAFPAAPRLAVPEIWQQRLGPSLAQQVWGHQRLWWQFWAEHGGGGAYLALPMAALPESARTRLPANSLQVDDLLVLAPDPLSLRLLDGELRLRQRQSRGLDQRCLRRLQQEQAVYWNGAGLGAMAGPMAPLLQHVQQGCLTLAVEGDQLALSGEATATPGYLAGPQQRGDLPLPAPLGPSQLLEWRGPSLDPLLSALLARQLIRDPLAQRYGVGDSQLALLRQTPFVLSLRSLAKGPFQAGLTLQLAVGTHQRQWSQVLMGWRQPLLDQGLNEGPLPCNDLLPPSVPPSCQRHAGAAKTVRWWAVGVGCSRAAVGPSCCSISVQSPALRVSVCPPPVRPAPGPPAPAPRCSSGCVRGSWRRFRCCPRSYPSPYNARASWPSRLRGSRGNPSAS